MKFLMDGPVDVAIDGTHATISGTSGGEPVTFTFRLSHALVSRQRFTQAYDEAVAQPIDSNVVNFPLPLHHAADSA